MTHSQRRHAGAVQLVNVGAHIQQQVEHIVVVVHLMGAQDDADQSEKARDTSCLASAASADTRL